jgi:hypothetical protein
MLIFLPSNNHPYCNNKNTTLKLLSKFILKLFLLLDKQIHRALKTKCSSD